MSSETTPVSEPVYNYSDEKHGSKSPIKFVIQIEDLGFVYKDADNTLFVVVEGTQPLDKAVSSSGQNSVTNSYSCEVCHKF